MMISVTVVVIIISKQMMSDSFNSTNCMMSNSSYSSDSVMNKSKDEVSVVVIDINTIFNKLLHYFVGHIINFFISKQMMSDSSNSANCMMSNSSYSSDSVVYKSKDEVIFFFTILG